MAAYNIGTGQTYATFAALVAGETLAAGDIVDGGGGIFRETWTVPQSGTGGNVIALQNALVYGSVQDTDSVWANTTGTEYTTTYTTEPKAVVLVSDNAQIKLSKGTAGALVSNQFDWGSNVLTINIGADPNGEIFEIGQRDNCVNVTSEDYITLNGIIGNYGNTQGLETSGADNIAAQGCEFSYNGGDGVHVTTSTAVDMDNVRADYNGYVYQDTGSGPGDGISYHANCTGNIRDCQAHYNYKAGIDNIGAGMAVPILRNTVSYSPSCIRLTGALQDQAQFVLFNKVTMDTDDSDKAMYGIDINLATTVDITVAHNTIIGTGSKSSSAIVYAVNRSRGDLTCKNNIIENAKHGVVLSNTGTESYDGDYNCFYDCNTNVSSGSAGGNAVTSDPLLFASGKLKIDSPCSDTGVVIAGINNGSELDIWGNVTDGTPNIGAYQGEGAGKFARVIGGVRL